MSDARGPVGPTCVEQPRNPRLVMAAVMVGTFLAPLDASIVNIALPSIARQLGVGLTGVGWVASVYLLTVASLVLTMGRLADVWGLRRVYVLGFAIFGTGSLLCALSGTFGALIASRAAQAVGASMMFAAGPAIVTSTVPRERRGWALGLVSLSVSFGLTVGPPLGGLLVGFFGWPSIFLINLPLAVLAAAIAWRVIPDECPAHEPFDFAGAFIGGGALLTLLLAMTATDSYGLFSPQTLGLAAGSVALWVAFVAVERRRTHPMLDLALFRIPGFGGGALSATMSYIALYAPIFLMPFYLEQVRGLDVRLAGLLLTATPLSMAIFAPWFGRLSDRRGSRLLAAGGLVGLGLSMGALSFVGGSTRLPLVALGLFGVGGSMSMFQSPNTSALLGLTPKHRLGVGSAIVSEARSVGMALGIALTAAVAAAGLPGAGASDMLTPAATAAFVSAMPRAFIAASIVAFAAAGVSWFRGPRHDARGRTEGD